MKKIYFATQAKWFQVCTLLVFTLMLNLSAMAGGPNCAYYFDDDGDGYGDFNLTQNFPCGSPDANYVDNNLDCNDADASINPLAFEVCDGSDNNCDGGTDEGYDNDSDGYTTCEGDCDDGYTDTYPGATELCDGFDNNCDGIEDDNDGDGWLACSGDCDDGDATINPAATEICEDGFDNDCSLGDEICVPAHDLCSNAVLITCASSPVSGSSFGATADIYTDCGAGSSGSENGVWYKYAGDDKAVTVTSCDLVTNYDTRLTVYTGNCGSLSCLLGNDDMQFACFYSTVLSQVTFNAYSGTDYYIFVHGYNGETGNFVLNLSCGSLCSPVPSNETCGTAENVAVSGSCTPVTVDNSCALPASDEPYNAPDYLTYPDIWLSFSAPASGNVTLTLTEGTSSELGYVLYDACGGFPVDALYGVLSGASNDIAGLTSGNTYYLQLYSSDANKGTFDYCLNETDLSCPDGDGDGVTTCDGDCDDSNPDIYTGATEICDAADNNCDGFADEGLLNAVYYDDEQDGFGDFPAGFEACGPLGAGYSYDNTDCNDEQWQFADLDGDGFGDPAVAVACGVVNNFDCYPTDVTYSDTDGDLFGALPLVACGTLDNSDCDDTPGTGWQYEDLDGDGFGSTTLVACGLTNYDDCYDSFLTYSDADGDLFGALPLVACGLFDNSDCDDTPLTGWQYEDLDGDGFGSTILVACGLTNYDDCYDSFLTYSDADGDLFGALPLVACGLFDNSDCDDTPLTGWQYEDIDGDGFGSTTLVACGLTNYDDCYDSFLTYIDADGDGFGALPLVPCGITDNNDCDDSEELTFPDATETCDGIDNDCDLTIDEGCGGCPDDDGDGVTTCDGDCDDNNPAVYPGVLDLCNDADDDCDLSVDEDAFFEFNFADGDGDGYGDFNTWEYTCDGPSAGYVDNADDCDDAEALLNQDDVDIDSYSTCDGDCDDNNPGVYPSAADICNDADDDCDLSIDEDAFFEFNFADADGDGYGEFNTWEYTCDGPSAGYVDNADDCDDTDALLNQDDIDIDSYSTCDGDCDDNNPGVYPSATDICNDADDDCDLSVDEDAFFEFNFGDGDGDGYGDFNTPEYTCDGPSAGFVDNADDCDDTDALLNQDDVDIDSHSTCDGDCDDNNPGVYPGATDICNGADDNCNSTIDEDGFFEYYFADADGDGYGDFNTAAYTCDGPPSGYIDDNTDCDDTPVTGAAINPGTTEVCDGIDNNCADGVDEGFDVDADGYTSCDGDCNDGDVSINPDATELCDDVDSDCDGTDEDADDDGYLGCADDCDDANAEVNPGATEICNAIDDDCNSATDEDNSCCTGFKTYSKGNYHNENGPGGSYLVSHFDAVYPGDFEVGCTRTITLWTANDLLDFLPSSGPAAMLNFSYINPVNPVRNGLATQVAVLKLNLDFDAFDEAFSSAAGDLKDLYVKAGPLCGLTVQQVFDEAQNKLGGCTSTYSAKDLWDAISAINGNYDFGNDDQGYLSCSPGCSGPKTISEYVDEEEIDMSINIYPNPTEGEITVEFYVSYNQEFKLQVVDLTGRSVQESEIISATEGVNKYNLNLENIAKGMYLLNRHSLSGGTESVRLTVK